MGSRQDPVATHLALPPHRRSERPLLFNQRIPCRAHHSRDAIRSRRPPEEIHGLGRFPEHSRLGLVPTNSEAAGASRSRRLAAGTTVAPCTDSANLRTTDDTTRKSVPVSTATLRSSRVAPHARSQRVSEIQVLSARETGASYLKFKTHLVQTSARCLCMPQKMKSFLSPELSSTS